MFKEGTCPRCHEKIQVPDEREKIICMFCGEEISVDEALGKKETTKVSLTEYEENREAARQFLRQIIENCENPMVDFKRDRYADVFDRYYAEHRPLFEAVDLMYTNAEQPEECLKELSGHLVQVTKEELQKQKSRRKQDQKQLDYNFLVSVYLIPTMLKYPAAFTDPLAELLVRDWNEAFHTHIGKAKFDDIASGFRKKLCYITTAVCTSLGKGTDCYELSVLKRYRDEQLETTKEGHELVEEYYNIAPTIVKRMEKQPDKERIYRELYEDYLLPCIHEIENQEYEACQDRYQEMVLELKRQYLN